MVEDRKVKNLQSNARLTEYWSYQAQIQISNSSKNRQTNKGITRQVHTINKETECVKQGNPRTENNNFALRIFIHTQLNTQN